MNSIIEHIRHITPEEFGALIKILLGSLLAMLAGWGFLHWATGGIGSDHWFQLLVLGGGGAVIFCVVCGMIVYLLRPKRLPIRVRKDN